MPNRLVREGFLDSEAIHALSDSGECFYHRLLLAADDAGRIDGRAEILRSRLFPLDCSRRASDVEKNLQETVSKGLVIPYQWDGRRYLQLSKWQRCSPCVTSKFPWSDGTFRIAYVKRETRDGEKEFVASSIGIAIPSASLPDGTPNVIPPKSGDGDGDGDGDGSSSQSKSRKRQIPVDFGISDRVKAWAERDGHNHLEKRLEHFASYAKRNGKTYVDWDEAFMGAVREDWAKLGAHVNGKPAPADKILTEFT